MKAKILNTFNFPTAILQGVFTDDEAFFDAVRKLARDIEEDRLNEERLIDLEKCSVEELNDRFNYLLIQEINLNELIDNEDDDFDLGYDYLQ